MAIQDRVKVRLKPDTTCNCSPPARSDGAPY